MSTHMSTHVYTHMSTLMSTHMSICQVLMVLIGGAIRKADIAAWTSTPAIEILNWSTLKAQVTPVERQLCISAQKAERGSSFLFAKHLGEHA